jgi:hypothetical protein
MRQLFLCISRIFIFSTVVFGLGSLPVSFCVSGLILGQLFRSESPFAYHYGSVLFVIIPVLFGLSYGLPMSLIMGIVQYYHVKKIVQSGPVDLSVRQSREVIARSEGIMDTCRNAIKELGARIVEEKSNDEVIFAKTEPSWKSRSEDIEMKILEEGGNTSKVIITSRPSRRTIMVDYGKDMENVEILKKFIEKA